MKEVIVAAMADAVLTIMNSGVSMFYFSNKQMLYLSIYRSSLRIDFLFILLLVIYTSICRLNRRLHTICVVLK